MRYNEFCLAQHHNSSSDTYKMCAEGCNSSANLCQICLINFSTQNLPYCLKSVSYVWVYFVVIQRVVTTLWTQSKMSLQVNNVCLENLKTVSTTNSYTIFQTS